MNLDLFNKLTNNNTENNIVQKFIKELGEFLEKSSSVNKESILQNEKITTEYRDKINIEKNKILNTYAKETIDEGTMYYIYSKNSKNEFDYNLCICEEGKSNKVIVVQEKELPKNAGIGSILRLKNEKYVLDSKATNEISNQVQEITNKLLEEQSEKLEEYRIEGHSYEVIDKSSDRVWLIDNNKNNEKSFEEIDFPEELLNKVNEGTVVKYINGKYELS